MSDFINTVDQLGDDVVMDSIIDRTITEFKDDKVTSVGAYAFYGCAALETVDLPNVTGYPGLGRSAFSNCSTLKNVNLPLWDTTTSATNYIFQNCVALETVKAPSLLKTSLSCFANCTNLTYVDLPSAVFIAALTFGGCKSLAAVVLRSATMASLGNISAFTSAMSDPSTYTPIYHGTGYIYVPSALVEDYKVATNWSTYADQFRALEDYTVDGTTTGELDESKI